jgi:hypothetical protein
MSDPNPQNAEEFSAWGTFVYQGTAQETWLRQMADALGDQDSEVVSNLEGSSEPAELYAKATASSSNLDVEIARLVSLLQAKRAKKKVATFLASALRKVIRARTEEADFETISAFIAAQDAVRENLKNMPVSSG